MEIKEDLLALFTLQDVQQKLTHTSGGRKPQNTDLSTAMLASTKVGNNKKASLAIAGSRHAPMNSPPRRLHTSNQSNNNQDNLHSIDTGSSTHQQQQQQQQQIMQQSDKLMQTTPWQNNPQKTKKQQSYHTAKTTNKSPRQVGQALNPRPLNHGTVGWVRPGKSRGSNLDAIIPRPPRVQNGGQSVSSAAHQQPQSLLPSKHLSSMLPYEQYIVSGTGTASTVTASLSSAHNSVPVRTPGVADPFVMKSMQHTALSTADVASLAQINKRGSSSSQVVNRSLVPLAKAPHQQQQMSGAEDLRHPALLDLQKLQKGINELQAYQLGSQQTGANGFFSKNGSGAQSSQQDYQQPRSKIAHRERTSHNNIIARDYQQLNSRLTPTQGIATQVGLKNPSARDYESNQLASEQYSRVNMKTGKLAAEFGVLKASNSDKSLPEQWDRKAVPRTANEADDSKLVSVNQKGLKLPPATAQTVDHSHEQVAGFRAQHAAYTPTSPTRKRVLTLSAIQETDKAKDSEGQYATSQHRSSILEENSFNTSALLASKVENDVKLARNHDRKAMMQIATCNSRMNHNISSLQMSDSMTSQNNSKLHKDQQANSKRIAILDNFKAKNVANRIRKQKQVRRMQQYSGDPSTQQEALTTAGVVVAGDDLGANWPIKDQVRAIANFVARQGRSTPLDKVANADAGYSSESQQPQHVVVKTQEDEPSEALQCVNLQNQTQAQYDQRQQPQQPQTLSPIVNRTHALHSHDSRLDLMISINENYIDNKKQKQSITETFVKEEEEGQAQQTAELQIVVGQEDTTRKSVDSIFEDKKAQDTQQQKRKVGQLEGNNHPATSLFPAITGHHSARSIESDQVSSPQHNGGIIGHLDQRNKSMINEQKRASALGHSDDASNKNNQIEQQSVENLNLRQSRKNLLCQSLKGGGGVAKSDQQSLVTQQYLHSMIKTPRQIRHEHQQQLKQRERSSVSLQGTSERYDIKMLASLDSAIGSTAEKQHNDEQQSTQHYEQQQQQSPTINHLISQRPRQQIHLQSNQSSSGHHHHHHLNKIKNRKASKNSTKNNSTLLKRGSKDNADSKAYIDSPRANNPYDLHQPYEDQQNDIAEQKQMSKQVPSAQSPGKGVSSVLQSIDEQSPEKAAKNQDVALSQCSIAATSYIPPSAEEKIETRMAMAGKFHQSTKQRGSERFEQWDVAGLGAVPHAINSGTRSLIFRPFYGPGITLGEAPKPPLNKGFFYKFNSSNEIKLIKYTLEDNGLCEYQHVGKHQLLPNQVKPIRDNWLLLWTTQSLKNGFFQSMSKHQKVNHFPRSIELTRKDFLANRIHRMQDVHGKHHFNFWPRTYILPKETDQLYQDMESSPQQYWICKPSNMAQGKGIFITNQSRDVMKIQNAIVSHYISNPLTVDKLKFDLRIYVAVTSLNPLRIYMYDEGLVRFATAEYSAPTNDSITSQKNRFIHLTNYSINKKNHNGSIASHTAKEEAHGSKWSFKALRQVLREHFVNDERLFGRIKDIVIKTIISSEPVLFNAFQMHVPHRNNCFQLFGFDVMIDDELNPWLLEVNLSPSLSCDSPLDHRIKANLVADLLNLAGIANIDQSQQGLQNQTNLFMNSGGKFTGKSQSINQRVGAGKGVYGVNQVLTMYQGKKSKAHHSNSRHHNHNHHYNHHYLGAINAHLTSGASSNQPNLNRVNGDVITKKEEILLREAEAEFKRKGRFSLIFPAAGTNTYKSYFEEPRHLNSLLYKRCVEKGLFSQIRLQERQNVKQQQQQMMMHVQESENNNQSAMATTQESFIHVD